MRKLVVFDLDQTLVDGRCLRVHKERHMLSGATIIMEDALAIHTYIRPHARTVLQICRGDPQMSIALFSAGDRQYVYKVVEEVLLPALDQTFYFDAIYCKDDLDWGSVKNMGKVMREMHADRVLLVDDLIDQCMYGAEPYDNVEWFNIKPFHADDEDADKDMELYELLKCSFFY